MCLTIAVENIKFKPGNASNKLPIIDNPKKTKLWKASDFRMNLGGLEHLLPNTQGRRSCDEDQAGRSSSTTSADQLAPTKTPSAIDFPNVTFYVPESHAGPFIDRFMANGGAPVKQEQNGRFADGSIEFLGSDLSTLATLALKGCDIVSVTPDKSDSTTENTKQVKVEMYCESMDFSYATSGL